jgi:hypothetical protein
VKISHGLNMVTGAKPKFNFTVKHPPVASDQPASDLFNHQLWTQVLQKYVAPGVLNGCKTNLVDYDAGLVAGDDDFAEYLQLLASATPSGWPANEQLAFYM